MNEQVTQTQVRAPWIFGARDNRHRGVEVDNEGQLLTTAEAIKQGGLDWAVALRHPITNDDDGVEAPDWRQVVKIEDVLVDGALEKEFRTLGMVKGRYTVLQNRDAFKFFDRATLEGAAVIKAVGHLDHGRVVWAVAQRPETIEIAPGDSIYQNMVLVTAHDGSHAAKVMFAPYRPSTGTMLGIKPVRRLRTEVRVRHTKSIDERMLDLHNVLAADKQKIVTDDQIKRVV
jgi:hypothetical protein